MNITPELEHAIEQLYVAFKGRELLHLMLGCPCCSDEKQLRHLSFTPLRELGLDVLEPYSWNAIWTVGTEEDYRHFAPRLLELMVRQNAFQPEIIAGKLVLAGWRRWSACEQQAIEAFFHAYWQAVLVEEATWSGAEDAICVLGNAFDDLSPFLDRWLQAPQALAIQHLAAFAEAEAANASQGFIGQPFWSDRPEQMRQVARWLASAETLRRLEERWLADPEGPAATALFQAIEYIAPAVRAAEASPILTPIHV